MKNPYSGDKILHHPDMLRQLKDGGQPVPKQVQLIISDLCNQDCGFCSYRKSGYSSNELFGEKKEDGTVNNNPNRMIPLKKVYEILNDCVEMGVKAIQLTGGGEPSVHRDHVAIVKNILDNGLKLGMVTNGMILRDETIEHFVRPNAEWIRFSIDAGNKESYSKIRKVNISTFDKVLNNIKKLVEYKELCGSELTIGVGFVITKENYKEVLQCAKIAKDLGVNSFRISAIFQNDGSSYFADIYKIARELSQEAEKLSNDDFRVTNMFGDRVQDLQDEKPDYNFCGYQHFNTYIGGDLNVYRCCVLAYNEKGKVGSLKDKSFKEMWTSKDKIDNMGKFDASKCDRCMFNNKNKMINYAIEDNPLHVNFV